MDKWRQTIEVLAERPLVVLKVYKSRTWLDRVLNAVHELSVGFLTVNQMRRRIPTLVFTDGYCNITDIQTPSVEWFTDNQVSMQHWHELLDAPIVRKASNNNAVNRTDNAANATPSSAMISSNVEASFSPVLLTEFVAGSRSLAHWMLAKPRSLSEVSNLLAHILGTLCVLHDMGGMAHMDVNTKNILV